MRRRAAAVILATGLILSGCRPQGPIRTAPAVDVAGRLVANDLLVRAGCLDCLVSAARDAHALLDQLHMGSPQVAAVVARDDLLVAIRERQLGMRDDEAFAAVRGDLDANQDLRTEYAPLLDIADTLGPMAGRRGGTNDRELERMQRAYRGSPAWLPVLHAHADEDALSASLWTAFACAYDRSSGISAEMIAAAAPSWRDTPLLRFTLAQCAQNDRSDLEGLLRADPRFVEIEYFLGVQAVFHGQLDEADARLQRAVAWRPDWPAALYSLAGVALTAEDFPRAVDLYTRTLAVDADNVDARLGQLRALVFAGRYEEAITSADRLLANGHWYMGDARYWRALAEAQLDRLEVAWTDVEAAAPLLQNADVLKLAGLIALRRRQNQVARERFDLAHTRNATDCETTYYLGLALADLREWPRAADVLHDAGRCLDDQDQALTEEIAQLRTRPMPEARRARLIARRQQQLESGRRMMPPTWYNAAVACYNLGRTAQAREDASRVAPDDALGPQAQALLARLPK
jgi:tetratricopeptide (TPR) repeat protein